MPHCCAIFFASKPLFKVSSGNTSILNIFRLSIKIWKQNNFLETQLVPTGGDVTKSGPILCDYGGFKRRQIRVKRRRYESLVSPRNTCESEQQIRNQRAAGDCLLLSSVSCQSQRGGGVILYNAEKKRKKNEATRGLSDHIHAAARQKQKSEAANVGFHHLRVVCGRAQSALCRRRRL